MTVQKGGFEFMKMMKLLFIIFTLGMLHPILTGCSHDQGITLDQFEQIQFGMSESEVERILGEGMFIHETGRNMGIVVRSYGWEGRGGSGFAVISINHDGIVIDLNQRGLE